MSAFMSAEPIAPIRMPRLPPMRSTRGPFSASEQAYTVKPTPEMNPKSSLVIRSPSAFLATVRL